MVAIREGDAALREEADTSFSGSPGSRHRRLSLIRENLPANPALFALSGRLWGTTVDLNGLTTQMFVGNACRLGLGLAGACLLFAVSGRAETRITPWTTAEAACADPGSESAVVPQPDASRWQARATRAIFRESAREHEAGSREYVLVKLDVAVALPRRHRRVATRTAGELTLLTCGDERLLLVVSHGDVRRLRNGPVVADMSITAVGATCDRSDRKIFEHGIDFYRVVFAGKRLRICRSQLAI